MSTVTERGVFYDRRNVYVRTPHVNPFHTAMDSFATTSAMHKPRPKRMGVAFLGAGLTLSVIVMIILLAGIVYALSASMPGPGNNMVNQPVESSLVELSDNTATTVVPGKWTLLGPDETSAGTAQAIVLNGQINSVPVLITITTLWAGFYVPPSLLQQNNASTPLRLLLDTVRLPGQCSESLDPSSDAGLRKQVPIVLDNVIITTPPSTLLLAVPSGYCVLGLGAGMTTGAYLCPLFDALQSSNLQVRWELVQVAYKLGLSARIPSAPCLNWCWSPMKVRGSGPDAVYVIPLIPSPGAPWIRAILNFGAWHSILPGVDELLPFVTLTTLSGCVITCDELKSGPIPALSPYIDEEAEQGHSSPSSSSLIPLTAFFGVSVGLNRTRFIMDIANQRFGRVVTA